jgi:hypothetical protein
MTDEQTPVITPEHLERLCLSPTGARNLAAYIVQLRAALEKAGKTCEDARKIADAALEIGLEADRMPGTAPVDPPPPPRRRG